MRSFFRVKKYHAYQKDPLTPWPGSTHSETATETEDTIFYYEDQRETTTISYWRHGKLSSGTDTMMKPE